MRINGTIFSGLIQSAATLSQQQTAIAQQLSSGVRISALSDDPAAAGRSTTISATLAQQDSFFASASTVTNRTQAADTALGAVVTQLTAAVTLAVQGQNDTQNATNRVAIAQQLTGIRDSILSLANSSYSGSYLFAGSQGSAVPFTLSPAGSVTYNGDANSTAITTATGGTITDSIAGSSIFLDTHSPVFTALQAAITNLSAGLGTGTDAVSALRNALSVVATQRSSLDSNLNRLNAEITYTSTLQAGTKAEQTNLLASDPVALATQLSAAQTQRSALLSTIAIAEKGSLFDYL